MPIHDWSRVSAGTFHAFYLAWIAELQRSLNHGVLPKGYYALAEQVAARTVPDVLTLQDLRRPLADEGFDAPRLQGAAQEDDGGGDALASAPPRVSVVESLPESTIPALKRRRIVIRHSTDDRVVALLEIVSPGNKSGAGPTQSLVDKLAAALQQGYHLMVIDLFAPGPSNPKGLHDRVWQELDGGGFDPPAGKDLTFASYRAGDGVTAYVEPAAIGDELPTLPLFLDPQHYVNVVLIETYRSAYEALPARWRDVIERSKDRGT